MTAATDDRGFVGSVLETFMRHQNEAEGDRPTAFGTSLRGSYSQNCARQLGFQIAGVPPTEEYSLETLVNFLLGRIVHEKIQEALAATVSGFEAEVPVDLRPLGYDLSGHIDGRLPEGDDVYALEIKTVNAYPSKLVRDEGPRLSDLLQAGIYAVGLEGCVGVHMVYVFKESSYRDKLKQGTIIEYRVPLDEHYGDDLGPLGVHTLRELVTQELDRLKEIGEQVGNWVIPARDIPGFGRVDFPPGYGDAKGQPWQCRFCRWNRVCSAMPPESVALENTPIHVQENWGPTDGEA
jgi:hypothetical protein